MLGAMKISTKEYRTALNMHTSDDLVELFLSVHPKGTHEWDETSRTLTMRIEGVEHYLEAKEEAIYGPGVAWAVCKIGFEDWGNGPVRDVLTRYIVQSVGHFKQAVCFAFGDPEPTLHKDARAFV